MPVVTQVCDVVYRVFGALSNSFVYKRRNAWRLRPRPEKMACYLFSGWFYFMCSVHHCKRRPLVAWGCLYGESFNLDKCCFFYLSAPHVPILARICPAPYFPTDAKIVSNVCYGVSYVLYNSWLPMLARKHWDVIDVKDAEEREQAFVRQ